MKDVTFDFEECDSRFVKYNVFANGECIGYVEEFEDDAGWRATAVHPELGRTWIPNSDSIYFRTRRAAAWGINRHLKKREKSDNRKIAELKKWKRK